MVKSCRSWSDEQIEALKKLWPLGLSAAEIGERIGKTRNMVIGMSHRLHLKSRSSLPKLGRPKKDGPRATALFIEKPRSEPAKPYVSKKAPEAPKSRMVPMLELNAGECRFPFGDGPFLFCGDKGYPYCAVHSKFVSQPHSATKARNKQAEKTVKEAA